MLWKSHFMTLFKKCLRLSQIHDLCISRWKNLIFSEGQRKKIFFKNFSTFFYHMDLKNYSILGACFQIFLPWITNPVRKRQNFWSRTESTKTIRARVLKETETSLQLMSLHRVSKKNFLNSKVNLRIVFALTLHRGAF